MSNETPWSTLAAGLTRLSDRIDALPTVREATVASDDPVAVMFDTDTAQTLAQGSLVGGLTVGARVLTLRLRHYVWILGAKAGSAGGASGVPTGSIQEFAGASAPAGWLTCDGSEVSRVTYPALFAVIGTTYGAGNGSTTFNLPNRKGRVGVGYDDSQTEFNALGETGGAKTHTLTKAEMPTHNHATTTDTAAKALSTTTSGAEAFSATGSNNYRRTAKLSDNVTGNAGSGGAHNNLQPYIVVNFIIKT